MVAPQWAPYRFGQWVWVQPWGWTWVDAAPWGFAPFRYGRWFWWGNRWSWAPGPGRPRPVVVPVAPGVIVGGRPPPPPLGWMPLGSRDPYRPGQYGPGPARLDRPQPPQPSVKPPGPAPKPPGTRRSRAHDGCRAGPVPWPAGRFGATGRATRARRCARSARRDPWPRRPPPALHWRLRLQRCKPQPARALQARCGRRPKGAATPESRSPGRER